MSARVFSLAPRGMVGFAAEAYRTVQILISLPYWINTLMP